MATSPNDAGRRFLRNNSRAHIPCMQKRSDAVALPLDAVKSIATVKLSCVLVGD